MITYVITVLDLNCAIVIEGYGMIKIDSLWEGRWYTCTQYEGYTARRVSSIQTVTSLTLLRETYHNLVNNGPSTQHLNISYYLINIS